MFPKAVVTLQIVAYIASRPYVRVCVRSYLFAYLFLFRSCQKKDTT